MPSHSRTLTRMGLCGLLLVALACTAPRTAGDAGHPGAPTGTACTADSDCASGTCVTSFPGGYCAESCADAGTCPAKTTCDAIGTAAYCLATCTADTDCRSGYVCAQDTSVCRPPCRSDAECSATEICDLTNGQCTTSGFVGTSCAGSTACLQGADPRCLSNNRGFPGGYCSSNCSTDSDCGLNSVCVAGIEYQTDTAPLRLCAQTCASNSDCRTGYNCVQAQSKSFCLEFCQSDGDCLLPSQTCDTNSGLCSAGSPVNNLVDAGPYPAPRPASPTVANSTQAGPVLQSPRIVPIFFTNDDEAVILRTMAFLNSLAGTVFWNAASEYNVGSPTVEPEVIISTAPPSTISDSQIQTWLKQQLDAGGSFPATDAETVYVIHYPMGTTITLPSQNGSSSSCNSFGGYHSDLTWSSKHVAYAVLPRCGTGFGGSSIIDTLTKAESHELIEASTDPYPDIAPAYADVDIDHIYWAIILQGASELGDMCEQDPQANMEFSDSPFIVQRFWSNRSAHAGHDPCVPLWPGEVFFNAIPEPTSGQTVTIDFAVFGIPGQSMAIPGTNIAVNGSANVTLDLYSDGPTKGPWHIDVHDISSIFGSSSTMTITLSANSGANGDKITANITRNSGGPFGGHFDIFAITSTLGQVQHTWYGLVGDP